MPISLHSLLSLDTAPRRLLVLPAAAGAGCALLSRKKPSAARALSPEVARRMGAVFCVSLAQHITGEYSIYIYIYIDCRVEGLVAGASIYPL